MEDFEETGFYAEESTYYIIDSIINSGAKMLYDNYLASKSLDHSVSSISTMVLSVVELKFMRNDPGEKAVWAEDEEVIPSSIDNWARHAIPVKKKVKVPKIEETQNVITDSKSITSFTSRRSKLGRGGKSSKTRNVKENNSIDETPVPVPISQEVIVEDPEEEYLRSRKERIQKKIKEDKERMQKYKEEEEAKEKKMQKDAEEIRNKSFTYDFKGKIVLITPIKYDDNPLTRTAIRYLSQDPVMETERKTTAKVYRRTSILPAKKSRGVPPQEQEWVRNMTGNQPTMIDSIKLSPGVTYSDGIRTKYPAETLPDGKNLTRKQYNAMYLNQSSMGANIIPNPVKKSLSMSSVDSGKDSPQEKKDYLDGIPDYDNSVEIEYQAQGDFSLSPVRSSNHHGRIIKYGRSVDVTDNMGPNEKFNTEIIKNKNWGNNPPATEPKIYERIPKKASKKEIKELFGDILKKPKDKPFITLNELWEVRGSYIKRPRDRPNIERVEKKTRMPPPPYGFTMINALPEIPGLGGSFIGKSIS